MQKYYSWEGTEWSEPSDMCKKDADGKPIGRSNQNTILDTCLYELEFPGGEMTELAADNIAESIYSQCNIDENEYLLLKAFIDHRKNNSALSV